MCVRQAPMGTEECTRRHPWCISARLSPLSWRRTVSCSELEFPCSMVRPATRACPASTFARWQTCRARPSQAHSLLHRRQPLPHDPTPLQGRLASWRRLRRHAAGPGQRQQARLRSERLIESRLRAAETRKRRSEAAAAAGAAEGGGGAD